MKNKLVNILLIGSLVVIFTQCEMLYDMNKQDDPDIEYSSTWPLSGEWYVIYRLDDGTELTDYLPLFTTNTAANDGKAIWINDGGNLGSDEASFWSYSVKVPCNVGAATFSGAELISTADWEGEPYPISINVTNGKVIEDGGLSTSGIVTDSIYFEIEFEDDPGTIYQCSGIRRTGFLEDEH